MNEINFDKFFKVNFDTAGMEDDIYNQIAKDIARSMDIDLAKTPLVDILTGYTRYKIQELEIERLNNIINELEKWLNEWKNWIDRPDIFEDGIISCINDTLDKIKELKGSDKE